MEGIVLVADQKMAIKEIFGDLITDFDRRIPAFEAAEEAYEQSKQSLRDEMKRLHEGLKRLDAAGPEALPKIRTKMIQIAEQDIPEKFGAFVTTFVDLILKFGEK